MFQGFNKSTILYYKAIYKENSKKVYQDNEQLYLEGVKFPLDELYFELYNYFNGVDRDLLSNRRRCISSAYNDARFCCGTPIKEYYSKEDIILQEWLERKRISCIHEENLSPVFYEREILNHIFSAFDSIREVYFMLKEAL